MAIPKTVDEFFVEVTRQTVKGTASVQDTFRRYLDRSADTNRTYLAVWDAVQQVGLHATFHFQNAVIQASQTMLGATLPASPEPDRQRPGSGRLWPEATLKVTRRGIRLIPALEQPAPSPEAESARARDWADSALQFQPPIGIIASEYVDENDDA